MAITRIYQPITLAPNQVVTLSREALQHVLNVLRLKSGQSIILFNGDNHEYHGELMIQDKRTAMVTINEKVWVNRESPLSIHLLQGIARGAKMDFIIQKAVELGVHEMTPVLTQRCNVKLIDERAEKRHTHWQQVAISAAEQCGRNHITHIHPPLDLSSAIGIIPSQMQRIVLAPDANHKLNILSPAIQSLALLIGPEGGLCAQELALAKTHGFISIALGPRILRTETAALVAVSILQSQYGDLQG